MLWMPMSLSDTPEAQKKVEEIYYTYRKLIYHTAIKRLLKPHLAEDAVHEVLLAVIRHLPKLEDRTHEELRSFLLLVTRNVCNDLLRKELRRSAEPLENVWHLPGGGDPQDRLGEQVLLDSIAGMADPYRDVLELTAFFGFTAQETAAILHISPATCRKRLERARKILRELLEKGEEFHGREIEASL